MHVVFRTKSSVVQDIWKGKSAIHGSIRPPDPKTLSVVLPTTNLIPLIMTWSHLFVVPSVIPLIIKNAKKSGKHQKKKIYLFSSYDVYNHLWWLKNGLKHAKTTNPQQLMMVLVARTSC